jgi:hypothetical protein
MLSTAEVAVVNTALILDLPNFQWDLGVLVETVPVNAFEPLLVATKANFDFSVAPNPVRAGQPVSISFLSAHAEKVSFE